MIERQRGVDTPPLAGWVGYRMTAGAPFGSDLSRDCTRRASTRGIPVSSGQRISARGGRCGMGGTVSVYR